MHTHTHTDTQREVMNMHCAFISEESVTDSDMQD